MIQEEIFENILRLMSFGVYFERNLNKSGYFHVEIIKLTIFARIC